MNSKVKLINQLPLPASLRWFPWGLWYGQGKTLSVLQRRRSKERWCRPVQPQLDGNKVGSLSHSRILQSTNPSLLWLGQALVPICLGKNSLYVMLLKLLALNQKQLRKWMTNPRIELDSNKKITVTSRKPLITCIRYSLLVYFFTRCNNFEHCFKIFLKSTECFSKVVICNFFFFFIDRTFINKLISILRALGAHRGRESYKILWLHLDISWTITTIYDHLPLHKSYKRVLNLIFMYMLTFTAYDSYEEFKEQQATWGDKSSKELERHKRCTYGSS